MREFGHRGLRAICGRNKSVHMVARSHDQPLIITDTYLPEASPPSRHLCQSTSPHPPVMLLHPHPLQITSHTRLQVTHQPSQSQPLQYWWSHVHGVCLWFAGERLSALLLCISHSSQKKMGDIFARTNITRCIRNKNAFFFASQITVLSTCLATILHARTQISRPICSPAFAHSATRGAYQSIEHHQA